MKNLILVSLAILSSQSLFSQLSITPHVGANYDVAEFQQDCNSGIGLNLGVDALYSFKKDNNLGWGLRAGIHFSQRNAYYNQFMYSNANDDIPYTNAVALFSNAKSSYLTIPVQINYGIRISDIYKVHLALGPSLDLGIAGNVHMSGKAASLQDGVLEYDQTNSKYDYFDACADKVNVGASAHVEFMAGNVSFIANYDFYCGETIVNGIKNSNKQIISVAIGYSF